MVLGFYAIENAKVRYGWGITLFKKQKQVTAGFFPIENAEIRYRWGVILYKMLK